MLLNIDGTKNKSGIIRHCTWLNLKIGKQNVLTRFLGKEEIILGLPWLKEHNPQIDWLQGTMNIETIRPVTTFGKVMRRTMELSQMFTPFLKPTLKEIFDNYEHLPVNPPLSDDNEILWSIYDNDDKETNIWHVWSYLKKNNITEEEEQNRVWVRVKTSISQGLTHNEGTKRTKTELPTWKNQPITDFLRHHIWHAFIWDIPILKSHILPTNYLSLTPTARIPSMTFKTILQKWQIIFQLKDFITSGIFWTRICHFHTISFCNWFIFCHNLIQRLSIYLPTFQLCLEKPATPQFPDAWCGITDFS